MPRLNVGPLSSWVNLNDALMNLSETQVEDLLRVERSGARRKTYMRRLHQRLTRLRKTRERRELLKSP